MTGQAAARCTIVLVFAVWNLSSDAGQRIRFEFIPDAFTALDMTPDGRFVVGSKLSGDHYVWDSLTDAFTTIEGALSAVAISDDGSTVLGSIRNPETPDTTSGSVSAIWTDGTQSWESLGYLPNSLNCPSKSSPYELSADGKVAVGLSWDGCNAFATRWTEPTGMIGLENLANGSNRASVVSADGRIVAGFAQGSFSRTPAVWDGVTGEGQLLDPSGDATGEIHGVRDDGSKLLGEINDGTYPAGRATIWSNVNNAWVSEMIGNGSFRPSWRGIPTDIAEDDTVVGFDILPGSFVRRAWMRRPGEAIMELNLWLAQNDIMPINPFTNAPEVLEVPQAISTNGRIIVGHGGLGSTGAWRIEIFSTCDLDEDFDCDIEDIDAMVAAIATGSSDAVFDLNGDGDIGLEDRDEWLVVAGAENLPNGMPYLIGDGNLDAVVDASDFNLWNANKFSATAAWSQGDFDADGSTDLSDFNLWNSNKFTSSSDHQVANVPEPNCFAQLLWVLFCFRITHLVRPLRR